MGRKKAYAVVAVCMAVCALFMYFFPFVSLPNYKVTGVELLMNAFDRLAGEGTASPFPAFLLLFFGFFCALLATVRQAFSAGAAVAFVFGAALQISGLGGLSSYLGAGFFLQLFFLAAGVVFSIAALAAKGMDVHAVYGCTDEEYQAHLRSVLSVGPNIIIDDGGDLVHLMHTEFTDLIPQVIGGCEETTTGIHRLRIMDRAGTLRFPMIMVNDADCKHLFDNRYGTGQSVWDGIMRTTNLVVAGKYVVVSGYGWCGKGVALRAKGLGAKVIVTEVDPIRALEAVMDGYEVMPMMDAAAIGDIFVSVTGCKDVITLEHCERMKDGAIVSNAGHFNVEIDMEALDRCADEIYEARHNIDAYRLPNGKTIYVIAQGRLVNLAAGDGHPAEIMDMSFAVQAMSAEYLVRTRGQLKPGVVSVPAEIDDNIARRKLKAMGVSIDSLSCSQKEYLNG